MLSQNILLLLLLRQEFSLHRQVDGLRGTPPVLVVIPAYVYLFCVTHTLSKKLLAFRSLPTRETLSEFNII